MKVFEVAMVVVFAALGLRSAWYWISRPFESTSVADHVLYALFVTGRVGLWWSVAGVFAIFLSISQGPTFANEAAAFKWYVVVPGTLAFFQLLGSVLLAGRADRPDPARPDDGAE
jgi:hypothetical protein